MGWEVHARHDEDRPQGISCRVWSTVVDAYITDEMNLVDAREFFLRADLEIPHTNARINSWSAERLATAIEESMSDFLKFWDEAEANLLKFGRSHSYYDVELEVELDEPWQEESGL